jgi:hypothetical protein
MKYGSNRVSGFDGNAVTKCLLRDSQWSSDDYAEPWRRS